jgi:hypothetical protein
MQLYAEENDAWSAMDCLQFKRLYTATDLNQSTTYMVQFM